MGPFPVLAVVVVLALLGLSLWSARRATPAPGSGPVAAFTFSNATEPESYEQVFTSLSSTLATDLTWRPDGRIARENTTSTGGKDRSYTYDAAGQLTCRSEGTATCPTTVSSGCSGGGTGLYLYQYDPRGHRLCQSANGTVTASTYASDDTGRLATTVTGSATTNHQWDADGRHTGTTGAVSTTNTYDARGLLTSLVTPSGTENRRYDGEERLVHTDRTPTGGSNAALEWTWDPTQPIPQTSGLHDNTGYVTGVFYYGRTRFQLDVYVFGTVPIGFNWHGDAVSQGTPITDYDPFGAPTLSGSTANPWDTYTLIGYQGELHFTNGVHLRNRDYNPNVGRFTTTDPLDGVDGNTTVANPYHYVSNDPLNRADPLGLRECDATFHETWGSESFGFIPCALLPDALLRACAAAGGPDAIYDFSRGACGKYVCTNKACEIKEFGHTIADGAALVLQFLPGYDCYDAIANSSLTSAAFCAMDVVPAIGKIDELIVGGKRFKDLVSKSDELADARRGNRLGGTCPVRLPHSFSADTSVLMANGTTKKISEIREGDEVLATNTETGETQARTVTDTMVMLHDGDLLDLTIEDEDGQGIIQTTDRHPFWSETDREWEHAIDLDEGEQLRQADGTTATVTDIEERDGRQAMFDLTVDLDHSFYVATGDDAKNPSALVHNIDCSIVHALPAGERASAYRLMTQRGVVLRKSPDPRLDWVDDAGKTYEHIGTANAHLKGDRAAFMSSLRSHSTKSADYLVVDMTGFPSDWIAEANLMLAGSRSAGGAQIITLGM